LGDIPDISGPDNCRILGVSSIITVLKSTEVQRQ